MDLPVGTEALRGRRAARWIRESTSGQADRYGPDAQREQQDRALERYGLVDTGVAWTMAHSGRTIAGTSHFAEMLAGAGRDYDLLLVGYVSRFARDLRTAVNARHDLHAAGAAMLFCDEGVLSSDEDAWEHWAREAVEAEAYSRRLGRRISEGYRAKRRRHGDPGGHPPFGFRRGEAKLIEPDLKTVPMVRRIVDLSAAGVADRAIAAETGIGLYTVRGVLTSPLVVGRLRDGSAANWEPLIEVATWERAMAIRPGVPPTPAGRQHRHGPMPCRCFTAPRADGASSVTVATTAIARSARASRPLDHRDPLGSAGASMARATGASCMRMPSAGCFKRSRCGPRR